MDSNCKRILLTGFLLVLWGCSYHFSGSGSLPSGLTRIYVSMLENKTAESGIENYLTNELINQFIMRRKDALGTQEDAEGILTGKIVYLQDIGIAHSSETVTTQSRVVLGVSLKLTDKKGKVVWAVNGINANQAYDIVSTSQMTTEQNKKAAITILSKRLAEKIFNRLTDDF